jgi:hypothetical protein
MRRQVMERKIPSQGGNSLFLTEGDKYFKGQLLSISIRCQGMVKIEKNYVVHETNLSIIFVKL